MTTVLRGSDNFDTAGANLVKSWVTFNGTGTVAIRSSLNVSSITDNGVGDYTVNFTTAFTDVNYSATNLFDTDADANSNFSASNIASRQCSYIQSQKTTSAFRIYSGANNTSGAGSKIDFREISLTFSR